VYVQAVHVPDRLKPGSLAGVLCCKRACGLSERRRCCCSDAVSRTLFCSSRGTATQGSAAASPTIK
jgi:hypothetical protein